MPTIQPIQPVKSPAYIVIADDLRMQIEQGGYRPEDKLPNERTLVDTYGVARMTVRHALDILQIEGLIDRRRGRTGGTFVRGIPPVVQLTDFKGIAEQLVNHDRRVEVSVVSADCKEATARIAKRLGIEVGAPVFQVSRLYTADSTPVELTTSYIASDKAETLLEEDLKRCQYDVLKERWGIIPAEKSETISTGVPSKVEQARLGIAPNQPVLRLARCVSDANGEVIDFSEVTLRTDQVRVKSVSEHYFY